MPRSRSTWLVRSIGTAVLATVYLVALAGFSRFEVFVLPLGDVPDRLFFVHIVVGALVGLVTASVVSSSDDRQRRLAMSRIVALSSLAFLLALALRRFLALDGEPGLAVSQSRGARVGELLGSSILLPVTIVLGWYWRITVRRNLAAPLLAGVASFAVLAGASELMEGELPVRPWQFAAAMILVALGFLWRIGLVLRARRAGARSSEGIVLLTQIILALVAFSTATAWFAAHLQELGYQRLLLPAWPDIVQGQSGFSPVRARDGGERRTWQRLSSDHEVVEELEHRPRVFFKAATLLPRTQGLFQSRHLEFGLGDRHLRQRSRGGDFWLNLDSGSVERWRPTDSGLTGEELARSDGRPFSSDAEIQSVSIAGNSLIHDPAEDAIWHLGPDRSYHPLVLSEGERIVSWGWRIDERLRYTDFDVEDEEGSVAIFLRGRIDNYLFRDGGRLEVDRFGRPARHEAVVVDRDLLAPVVVIRGPDGGEVFRHGYRVHDLGEHLHAAPIVVATLLRPPLLNLIAFLSGEDSRPERVHKALVIDPLLVAGSRSWLLLLSLGLDLIGVFMLRRRLRGRRTPSSRIRAWLSAALVAGPVLVVFALLAEKGNPRPTSVQSAS